ncbi:energy transducer TonB [Polaromonas sp.]|jgi:protein TonB|uniref:energy transducer TonB n=1 Tax=Polaromonas sp. TaxID=1869339 RepID=UPI0037C89E72
MKKQLVLAAALIGAAALAQTQPAAVDRNAAAAALVLSAHARPEAPLTPDYPPAALRLEQQGEVMVKLRVLASGAAADVQLRASSGYHLLDEAALRYLRGARFVPAQDGSGQPVDSLVIVPIRFVLQD